MRQFPPPGNDESERQLDGAVVLELQLALGFPEGATGGGPKGALLNGPRSGAECVFAAGDRVLEAVALDGAEAALPGGAQTRVLRGLAERLRYMPRRVRDRGLDVKLAAAVKLRTKLAGAGSLASVTALLFSIVRAAASSSLARPSNSLARSA